MLNWRVSGRLTWLRRIASCFFLTLAILFAAMWVRSCYCIDSIGMLRFKHTGRSMVGHWTSLIVSGYGSIEVHLEAGYPYFAQRGGPAHFRFDVSESSHLDEPHISGA